MKASRSRESSGGSDGFIRFCSLCDPETEDAGFVVGWIRCVIIYQKQMGEVKAII
jgi:hypothetical protein